MRNMLLNTATALLAVVHISEATASEWNVSLWGEERGFTSHIEELARLVSEKTDGGFTLNLSYGGLAKDYEHLDGVMSGDFQMAQTCVGYHPERLRILSVLELPFLGIASLEQERDVSLALYRHPAVVNAMAKLDVFPLMPTPVPQYNLVGTGSIPSTVDDLNGLTVRSLGDSAKTLESLGADAVFTPFNLASIALKIGAIDAVSFSPQFHLESLTLESSNWRTTNLNLGTVNCPVIVNSTALNDLHPDHYTALLSSVDEALGHYIAYYNLNIADSWERELLENNISEVVFDNEELSDLREKAAGKWIGFSGVFGIPARELYEFTICTIQLKQFCQRTQTSSRQ